MAQELCVIVSAEDSACLAAVIGDRNRPLKHIQRAQIILFSAARLPVLQVARRAGTSRPAVWRWQKRYAEAGVDGLLRDKTRLPGRKPIPTATVAQVLALTQSEPTGEATRWTFHFTPKSGSWLNAVEGFFAKLTRQRLGRGIFRSIVDLQAAINRYLKQHNDGPKPFVWTKPADAILAKLNRLPVPSV